MHHIYFGGVRNPSNRKLIVNAWQISTVAITFLITTQYWPIREHLVFFLVFIQSVAMLLLSNGSLRTSTARLVTLGFFSAFLFWLLLSSSWSPTPHMSLAYGLLALLVGFSAVFQGLTLEIRNFALGLVLGVGFQVAHSVFLFLTDSGEDPSHLDGLYTNRSSLSLVIGISLIAIPFVLQKHWFSLLALGLTQVVLFWYLIGLNILTSYFALFGAFAVGFALLTLRRQSPRVKKPLAGFYLIAALGGTSTFWFFRGPILRIIGEDASMSGRVPLWELYFEAVLWRPVFGSGWGSTVGWDFPLSSDRLSPVVEWFPAHNGYLDTALMLGFVGLAMLLGVLLTILLFSARDASNRGINIRSVFIPMLLTYLMVNDIMATSLPKLLGIYLVGILVGLVVGKPSDQSDDFGSKIEIARPFRSSANRDVRSMG